MYLMPETSAISFHLLFTEARFGQKRAKNAIAMGKEGNRKTISTHNMTENYINLIFGTCVCFFCSYTARQQ